MEFELDEALSILRRTPRTLRELLLGLSEAWIHGNEGADTFSPFDVVGHLIDGEETDWIARAKIVLAGDVSRRFDRYDRFRHKARNVGRTLSSLLEEFERLRSANLEVVESWRLGAAELAMQAEHPTFGRVTLRQLLATWVVHDLSHLGQIARTMAKQYTAEVGPWTQFLPILAPRSFPTT